MVLKQLNSPVMAMPDDESYALTFANMIEAWSQDIAGISEAKQRLKATGKFADENYGVNLPYLSLAIMLNSLTTIDTGELGELRSWVRQSKLGWPGFFFAAGLLLSSNRDVRWEKWG